MTSGQAINHWGATEVSALDIACCVPAPCDVKHYKLAARGLLSFLSLLRAFRLHVIKRNQAAETAECEV